MLDSGAERRISMKHTRLIVLAISVSSLLLTVSASAKEKHIKKSDLPPAVQKTADEQSKGASVRGYSSEVEGGKLEYEVQMTIAGHSRDVSIAPDGTVLEIEEEVAMDALPVAVREGLKKKATDGTITKVESITKSGKLVAYEAHVKRGTKRSEIQIDPEGKPLSHPE
jgi:uncharacterized membrane protein YkoI